MLRAALVVLTLAAALADRAAAADSILYATAATPGRVDGFCVGPDGGLAGKKSVSVNTAGDSPRRLLVGGCGPGSASGAPCALYVGESDRVESFQILEHGSLKFLGATKRTKPAMNVFDMAFSPDRKLLYVAENGEGRVTAYPIESDGKVAEDFTSCIQVVSTAQIRTLVVHNKSLYLSQLSPGRVAIFPILDDGNFFGPSSDPTDKPADHCSLSVNGKARSPETQARSQRTKLGKPRGLVVVDDRLYVGRVNTPVILQFRLDEANGNFDPPIPVKKEKKTIQAEPESRTDQVVWYADLQLFGQTLLGTQFDRGRVDAYSLLENGEVPKKITRISDETLAASPVRMAISPDGVAYVSGGLFDRIVAYRLGASGGLADKTPFSETEEQNGSFPNDVALATPPNGCIE